MCHQRLFQMLWFIVQCSSEKHPDCGLIHIWYYDQPSDKWIKGWGTEYKTKEEAERVAFNLVLKHDNQIRCINVVGEEERV